MKYDLFISHSSADAAAALAFAKEIEKRGVLRCWIAPRDIPIGASYQGEIVRGIENSGAFVLLFSRATNESEHVLRELELAERSRKAIYPIKIDASEPTSGLKYILANKQWVERKALGNRLVETIEQMVLSARGTDAGAEPPPAHPASPPPPQTSAWPKWIAAAAIILLLLGGGLAAWKGDWLGFEAKERERLAQEEKASTEKLQREKEAAELKRLQEKEAQDQREAEQRKQAETLRQQALQAEEERRKREAIPASLPVQPPVDNDIKTSAPTVGDAVPGKTLFRECDLCPVMAVVPAGSNLIGSPPDENGRSNNEGPQQPVVFRVPLAVGRSEVSFEEYLACVAEGGCRADRPGDYGWGYDKQPAINVSWNDAQRYVEWLSQKTKARYRLLSEAEWEYAARGCSALCGSTPFWFGIQIAKERANYDWRYAYLGSPKATPRRKTVPIDASEPNPFGLLHVHGNVREWVEDCWNESLAGIPRDGTARTTGDCNRRVIRGGSWNDEPKDLRSAKRFWDVPSERRPEIGFRVARELKL